MGAEGGGSVGDSQIRYTLVRKAKKMLPALLPVVMPKRKRTSVTSSYRSITDRSFCSSVSASGSVGLFAPPDHESALKRLEYRAPLPWITLVLGLR